jgi:hypothetical protein
VAAAQAVGLDFDLVNYEALVDDRQPGVAVRHVREWATPDLAIYRGWMLRPESYTLMFEHLERKGVRLINSPAAYLHCQYLPEWYPVIAAYTPKSVWLPAEAGLTTDAVAGALGHFGTKPVIVKDFVKSRKHEWEEACYIPSATDLVTAERVVGRFLQLQGNDLTGGLVFREFVELEQIGRHPKSGMPLAREVRLFVLDGVVIGAYPYWPEGADGHDSPPLALFTNLSHSIRSRFFTMDVARRTDGEWIIVELGDGQVAGLPEGADPHAFYQALVSQGMPTA